jgi:hypothetical protein
MELSLLAVRASSAAASISTPSARKTGSSKALLDSQPPLAPSLTAKNVAASRTVKKKPEIL